MLMEESLIPYAYACLFLYMFRAQSHEMYLYSPRMCPSRRTWISCISQRPSLEPGYRVRMRRCV